MSLGWMFLILGLLWLALLAMLVVTVRQWLAEEIGPALDGDGLEDEPRLVSACRELSELAAKTREASHG
ncbi:hypothetical protein ACET9K_11960 [Aeromonas enteropelogenes]|uniref:hypothetical protein n=1 Tax=Aeromonas TaxID=642 RepID=UPI001C04333D|nr:hypothetical protein [Aeromonas jandaei]QWL64869.1 hypothetical protein HQ398_00790 [Aeromonas jandaei]